jgi:hypothetical protein
MAWRRKRHDGQRIQFNRTTRVLFSKDTADFFAARLYGRGSFVNPEVGGKAIADLNFGPIVELPQNSWLR